MLTPVKDAIVLNQDGMEYTTDNIDALLLACHTGSEEYCINMMIAQYLATDLAKHPKAAMLFLRGKHLGK